MIFFKSISMKQYYWLAIVFLFSCVNQLSIDDAEKLISYDKIASDILVLASDSLAGRAPFTPGEEKTLRFLKNRMQLIGLEPAFNGDYFQEVPLVEITSKSPNEIFVKSKKGRFLLKIGSGSTFWSPSLSNNINIENSELIFAGFGINAPEWNWNDFKNIDLAGKTIIVLVNDPGFHSANSSLFNGKSMTYYGRWRYKFEEAEKQGAAGCIIIHEDEAAGYPWSVVDGRSSRSDFYLDNENINNNTCRLNGWISKENAIELFAFCGLDYEKMKLLACTPGFKPMPMAAKYSITIENQWTKFTSFNVGGIIRGTEAPNEAIVYTAHWDHLGIGAKINGDSIYNGASDNAAAVAWMLSIAEAFKSLGSAPKRSILFLSPTTEEAGMLGSQYYVENPVFSIEKTVACFNSDVIMFLGSFKDVTVTGLGHSELDVLLEKEAAKQGRYICNDPNPENGMFYRSDQLPFLKAGVPSLFAKGYSHQVEMGREKTLLAVEEYWRTTYHKPSDEYLPNVHKLDGLVDDTKLFFRLGYTISNSTHFPKWNKESEFFVER